MKKTLTLLAFEAGLRPFEQVAILNGDPDETGIVVEAMMGDRNLYFTKEYRERYGIQVHRVESSPQRLALGVVESALPPGEQLRRYRTVILRCDGAVVYQTSDNRSLDWKAACVDCRYWISHLDESKMLVDLCKGQMRLAQRDQGKAEAILKMLHPSGP